MLRRVLVLLAITIAAVPTSSHAAQQELRKTPPEKEIRTADPKQIKAPDQKQIKAPDPKQIKAPDPKQIKTPEDASLEKVKTTALAREPAKEIAPGAGQAKPLAQEQVPVLSQDGQKQLSDGTVIDQRNGGKDLTVISGDGTRVYERSTSGPVTKETITLTEANGSGKQTVFEQTLSGDQVTVTKTQDGRLVERFQSLGNGGRQITTTVDAKGRTFETVLEKDTGTRINTWADDNGRHKQEILSDGTVRTLDELPDHTLVASESRIDLTDPQHPATAVDVKTVDSLAQVSTSGGRITEESFKANGAHIVKTTDQDIWGGQTRTITTANGREVDELITNRDVGVGWFNTTTTKITENGQTTTVRHAETGLNAGLAKVSLTGTMSDAPLTHGYWGVSGDVSSLGGLGPGIGGEVAAGRDRVVVSGSGKIAGAKVTGQALYSRDTITDATNVELGAKVKAPLGRTGEVGIVGGTIADETRKTTGGFGGVEASTNLFTAKDKRITAGVGVQTTTGEGTKLGAYGSYGKKLGHGMADAGGGVVYDTKKGGVSIYEKGQLGDMTAGSGTPDFGKLGVPGKSLGGSS